MHRYVVPDSDSGFTVGVAELPFEAQRELDDALRAASDTYTREETYYGTDYSGEIEGGLSTIKVVYSFDRDRWTVATGGDVTIDGLKLVVRDAHEDRYTAYVPEM